MSSEKYLNNGAQEYPPKIKHEDLLEKIAEIESVLKTFDELENKTSDELNEIKILKTEVSRLKLIAEQSKEDYEDLDFEPTNLYIETAKQIIEAKKINNKTEYEHIPDTKQFEKYKKYFSKNPQNFLEVNSSNAVDEIEKFNAKITRQFHPDLIGESKPNWRLERAIATQAIYRVNVATKKLIDEKDVFFNNTWEKREAKREAKRETREINKEWLKEDEAEIKIIFDFFTNFSSENTHFLYIVNDLKDILEVFSLAVDDEVYIKDNEKTDIIIYQKLKRGEKLNEGERSTTLDYIQKMIKIKDIIERVQILQNQQVTGRINEIGNYIDTGRIGDFHIALIESIQQQISSIEADQEAKKLKTDEVAVNTESVETKIESEDEKKSRLKLETYRDKLSANPKPAFYYIVGEIIFDQENVLEKIEDALTNLKNKKDTESIDAIKDLNSKIEKALVVGEALKSANDFMDENKDDLDKFSNDPTIKRYNNLFVAYIEMMRDGKDVNYTELKDGLNFAKTRIDNLNKEDRLKNSPESKEKKGLILKFEELIGKLKQEPAPNFYYYNIVDHTNPTNIDETIRSMERRLRTLTEFDLNQDSDTINRYFQICEWNISSIEKAFTAGNFLKEAEPFIESYKGNDQYKNLVQEVSSAVQKTKMGVVAHNMSELLTKIGEAEKPVEEPKSVEDEELLESIAQLRSNTFNEDVRLTDAGNYETLFTEKRKVNIKLTTDETNTLNEYKELLEKKLLEKKPLENTETPDEALKQKLSSLSNELQQINEDDFYYFLDKNLIDARNELAAKNTQPEELSAEELTQKEIFNRTLSKKLESVGISQNHFDSFIQAIESKGISLSDGKKLFFLNMLEQDILKGIERKAEEEFKKDTEGVTLNPKTWSPTKLFKMAGRRLGGIELRKGRIAKDDRKRKEIITSLIINEDGTDRAVELAMLINEGPEQELDTTVKGSNLRTIFLEEKNVDINGEELINQHSERYNKIASEVAALPPESDWKFYSKEQRRNFTKLKVDYSLTRRRTINNLQRGEISNLDQTAAIAKMHSLDAKLEAYRSMIHNPEAMREIQRLQEGKEINETDKKFLESAIGQRILAFKNAFWTNDTRKTGGVTKLGRVTSIITGGGSRWAVGAGVITGSLISVGSLPLILAAGAAAGAVRGSIMGNMMSKGKIDQKDIDQREGKKSEPQRKSFFFDRINRKKKLEKQEQEIKRLSGGPEDQGSLKNDFRDAYERMDGEAIKRLKKEEAELLNKYYPDRKIDRGFVSAGKKIEEEGREAGLNGKIKQILTKLEKANDETEESKLMDQLRTRLYYTQNKLKHAEVNFGGPEEASINKLNLIKTIELAESMLTTNEPEWVWDESTQIHFKHQARAEYQDIHHKEINEVELSKIRKERGATEEKDYYTRKSFLDSLMNDRRKDVTENRKSNIKRGTGKGALMGAAGGMAGALVGRKLRTLFTGEKMWGEVAKIDAAINAQVALDNQAENNISYVNNSHEAPTVNVSTNPAEGTPSEAEPKISTDTNLQTRGGMDTSTEDLSKNPTTKAVPQAPTKLETPTDAPVVPEKTPMAPAEITPETTPTREAVIPPPPIVKSAAPVENADPFNNSVEGREKVIFPPNRPQNDMDALSRRRVPSENSETVSSTAKGRSFESISKSIKTNDAQKVVLDTPVISNKETSNIINSFKDQSQGKISSGMEIKALKEGNGFDVILSNEKQSAELAFNKYWLAKGGKLNGHDYVEALKKLPKGVTHAGDHIRITETGGKINVEIVSKSKAFDEIPKKDIVLVNDDSEKTIPNNSSAEYQTARIIEKNAEDLGYEGDMTDKKSLNAFVNHEVEKVVEANPEIRYAVTHEGDKLSYLERDADGKYSAGIHKKDGSPLPTQEHYNIISKVKDGVYTDEVKTVDTKTDIISKLSEIKPKNHESKFVTALRENMETNYDSDKVDLNTKLVLRNIFGDDVKKYSKYFSQIDPKSKIVFIKDNISGDIVDMRVITPEEDLAISNRIVLPGYKPNDGTSIRDVMKKIYDRNNHAHNVHRPRVHTLRSHGHSPTRKTYSYSGGNKPKPKIGNQGYRAPKVSNQGNYGSVKSQPYINKGQATYYPSQSTKKVVPSETYTRPGHSQQQIQRGQGRGAETRNYQQQPSGDPLARLGGTKRIWSASDTAAERRRLSGLSDKQGENLDNTGNTSGKTPNKNIRRK